MLLESASLPELPEDALALWQYGPKQAIFSILWKAKMIENTHFGIPVVKRLSSRSETINQSCVLPTLLKAGSH